MIILAPMQGLTELLFRRAYEQVFPHALDVAVSPFISLTHGSLKDALKKISDVLPENNLGSIPDSSLADRKSDTHRDILSAKSFIVTTLFHPFGATKCHLPATTPTFQP